METVSYSLVTETDLWVNLVKQSFEVEISFLPKEAKNIHFFSF